MAYTIHFLYQPANRNVSHRAGKVLEPHIIIQLQGEVQDTRYFARASAVSDDTQLEGNNTAVENSKNKVLGERGSVDFEFEKLRIDNAGTHQITVTIYEQEDSGGFSELCSATTEEIKID